MFFCLLAHSPQSHALYISPLYVTADCCVWFANVFYQPNRQQLFTSCVTTYWNLLPETWNFMSALTSSVLLLVCGNEMQTFHFCAMFCDGLSQAKCHVQRAPKAAVFHPTPQCNFGGQKTHRGFRQPNRSWAEKVKSFPEDGTKGKLMRFIL